MTLLFVMTGAEAVSGGIATLNLNILHVLGELAEERNLALRVFSYFEQDLDRPEFLPSRVKFRGFRGNRRALVGALLRAAGSRPIMVFDHVTIALPVLPLAAIGLVKTAIFAHGSESWRYLRRTSRWSFSAATLVLTNSHFTLKKMRERIPRFNGVACPLGLSPRFKLNAAIPRSVEFGVPPSGGSDRVDSTANRLKAELQTEDSPARHIEPPRFRAVDGQVRALGDQMLLMVARMHPDEPLKGHLPLLKVWPAVAREFPQAQLVFAGAGENRAKLEQLARASGAGSSIFLTGAVTVEVLEQLYGRCYGFVMPSKQEGFGLVFLEAMNWGKPCLGCFDDGAEDVIVHQETGLLVRDPTDTPELLQVLRTLLSDPARASQMGSNGFARLHERFTTRHVQERIKQHIGGVLT